MTIKKNVFISFDYEHDEDAKILLAEQARLPDSPFEITDASEKVPLMTGRERSGAEWIISTW